jgi:hypothetical protein
VSESKPKRSVLKPALEFASTVGAIVVGGVILEYVVRRLDSGRLHFPGLEWNPRRAPLTPVKSILGGLAPTGK